ncbi:MAG: cation:proton antiporter [bacterium]
MNISVLNLLLVLAAAWGGGLAVRRLGLPSIVGELLAGIIFGPPILGLIQPSPALMVLAEVGVILLLLYVGMEIDPKELKKASWGGLLVAIGSFLLPFALGFLVIRFFGGTLLAATLSGILLGVTSLTTNSRILLDLQLLDTRIAHTLLAGALVAEILGLVAFASLLGVIEVGSADFGLLLEEIGLALIFLSFTAIVGHYLLPPAAAWLVRTVRVSSGMLFLLILAVGFLFAELAELAGLHAILGAFMIGLFLRDVIPDRSMNREVIGLVEDISLGFMAPIFFVVAGFQVTLGAFAMHLPLLAVVVVVAIASKVVGSAVAYLPTGHGLMEGLAVGAGMSSHGAVEIIIAGIGLESEIIGPDLFSVLVIMTIVSTITAPMMLKHLTNRMKNSGTLVRSDRRRGVLIVGAGPTACLVAGELSRWTEVTLLDSSPSHCETARRLGLEVEHGNALKEDVLEQAGAEDIRTLVALTSNAEVNVLAARLAREVFLVPEVHVTFMHGEKGAHAGLIEPIEATTLFAGPADISGWDRKIALGHCRISTREVTEPADAAEFLDSLGSTDRTLPIIILRGDGLAGMFHAGCTLQEGDRVVMLEQEQSPVQDEFDELVREADLLDIEEPVGMEELFRRVAGVLEARTGIDASEISGLLIERERMGSTVVGPDLAVPHILLDDMEGVRLVVVRCRRGVRFPDMDVNVHTVFVLASGSVDRTLHLRILSAVAQTIQDPGFEDRWLSAPGEAQLRDIIRYAERRRIPFAGQSQGAHNRLP